MKINMQFFRYYNLIFSLVYKILFFRRFEKLFDRTIFVKSVFNGFPFRISLRNSSSAQQQSDDVNGLGRFVRNFSNHRILSLASQVFGTSI